MGITGAIHLCWQRIELLCKWRKLWSRGSKTMAHYVCTPNFVAVSLHHFPPLSRNPFSPPLCLHRHILWQLTSWVKCNFSYQNYKLLQDTLLLATFHCQPVTPYTHAHRYTCNIRTHTHNCTYMHSHTTVLGFIVRLGVFFVGLSAPTVAYAIPHVPFVRHKCS